MVLVILHEGTKNQQFVLPHTEITIIGRGFMECNDKRVSKKHAEVMVIEGKIKLKSISTNPLFYKLKDEVGKQILRKDSEIELGNLDLFSLLPNEFEFTVKVIENEDSSSTFPLNLNENTTVSSSTMTNESENRKRSFDDSEEKSENSEPKKMKSAEVQNEVLPSSTSSTTEEPKIDDAQSISTSSSNNEINIKPDPDSTCSSNNQNLPSTSNIKIKPDPDANQSTTSDIKINIKPDPDTVKPEPAEANEAAESTTLAEVNEASSCQDTCSPQPQPQSNLRPSCEFGIRCYRQTSDHLTAFAHPMDTDYRRPNNPPSLPNSPMCQFGASCYRRNPEHLRTFQHPTNQYIPPSQNNILVPNVYNDDDDDDDADISDGSQYENDDDSDVDRDYEIDGGPSSDDEAEENNLEE